jgi:glycosyltransferase involved in cell wall biosynthesis
VIRVAHLLPSLEIGGKERTVIDLCARAADYGQSAAIISYDKVADGRARLTAGNTPHFILDRHGSGDFDEALQSLVADQGFDIIHAHGQVSAIYAARLAKSNVRRIATLHTALGEGWRWLPAIRFALRQMDCVTAVSDDVAKRFSWWVSRDMKVIHTGIDLARFSKVDDARTDTPFTIGMVARLHKVKRHCDAIAAIAIMRAQGSNARLIIVGDGPEEARLRKQAQDMSGIEFWGPVEDTAPLYGKFDAFLLCSDHEAMPLALLEAMASGLPCVVTDVGGMRDFVAQGAAVGSLPRQPHTIAKALISLENSKPLRERTVALANQRVQDFSLEKQAKNYANLYRKVCNQAVPPTVSPSTSSVG